MFIVQFGDAACLDTSSVGGKASGLASMSAKGLPVAPGFVVAANAYRAWAGRRTPDQLDPALPGAVADEVRAAYRKLCAETGVDAVAVAVRSSATAEDSADASFAGEFETWVDVVGEHAVVEHVRKCYQSVFSDRVVSYLASKSMSPDVVEMAVVVQKTVRARAAGVMFTLSPTTGDRSKIAIEASWGLGLSVVGGEVTPDRFVVNKVGLDITERTIGRKHTEYRRGDAAVPVAEHLQEAPCLDNDEIVTLARLGKQLEKLHGRPQDIEFALDSELSVGNNVILLQCRPETVWSSAERKPAFDAGTSLMSWITGSISGAPTGAHGAVHGHEGHEVRTN